MPVPGQVAATSLKKKQSKDGAPIGWLLRSLVVQAGYSASGCLPVWYAKDAVLWTCVVVAAVL